MVASLAPSAYREGMKLLSQVAVASVLALQALAEERNAMIETQLRPRGIQSEKVLEQMARIPREEFVPAELAEACL